MNIKRSISFVLESRRKHGVLIEENIPIRIRVTYCGKRIDLSAGYRIDTAKWDANKQRARNGCWNASKQSASEINASLNRYEDILHSIFKDFEVREYLPSVDEVKEAFNVRCGNSKNNDTKQQSVFPLFDTFIKEGCALNSWSESTEKTIRGFRNKLFEFSPSLTLDLLTHSKLAEFVTFLRVKRGMRNITIAKNIANLKWFLRWMVKKGYLADKSFEDFSPKLKTSQKRVIFLTWDELNKVRECEIPAKLEYLEKVRDVFLFSCFTGLRYSDVYNLRKSDIKDDKIQITTIKTADSITIELNNHSRAILEKYKGISFRGDRALPVISNQKMNDYLKELCKLSGIDEPIRIIYYSGNERIEELHPKYELISTHAGRRTFICNALALGIPAQVVMKWTGHSDYKAMKPYIDIASEVKASAMSKFDRL